MFESKFLNPVGRANLLEPIIVSGKYFNIKLLSAYDFMLCTKISKKFTIFHKKITPFFSKKMNVRIMSCFMSELMKNF